MTKRTQGRPPRDSGVNGREKLIEATRVYLQTHRKLSLTRSEIAQGCGVTPALISYYFKDKRSLLDAVTKPLIHSYRAQLTDILQTRASPVDKMRSTVRLLIEMNADNAFLVDHMLSEFLSDKLDAEDRRAFEQIRRVIADLVADLVTADVWRPSDPLLTEMALWGMCRAFGEAIRTRSGAPDPDVRTDRLQAQVDYVFGAFAANPLAAAPASLPA